jgi:hypothetical protein
LFRFPSASGLRDALQNHPERQTNHLAHFDGNDGNGLFQNPLVQRTGGTFYGRLMAGLNLAGATGVTFNSVAATFKVVSATEITTTVPTGTTTGKVEVVTFTETLNSNVNFRVLP